MTDRERPPDGTPWGHKDFEDEPIPGFTMVHTSRHGGLYLTAKQQETIPDALKPPSAGGEGIWWEEDCAWSLPVVFLLSKRPQSSLSHQEKSLLDDAHKIARDYYPDLWESLTGRKIRPGESEERDREDYLLQRADNLIVGTAWGSWASWVPKGMVGVAAWPGKLFLGPGRDQARAQPARFFLVPEKEYRAGSFVVDPKRHQEVTGKEGVPPSKWEDEKPSDAQAILVETMQRLKERKKRDDDRER